LKRQKITPNPAISSVSVARRHPDPVIAEMMRRNERILAEAMARQIEPPPPQPHRDPQPMATLHQIPDPLAGIGWDSALELWSRISTPVMFAVWSIGCFALGRLS